MQPRKNRAALQNAQPATQATLANQAAQNRAAEFTSQAANVAALQNAAARNAASQFIAQVRQTERLWRIKPAVNQAAQFGAQAANTAGLQNAQLATQAALATAAAQNQANQFTAGAANQAALANRYRGVTSRDCEPKCLQLQGANVNLAGRVANLGQHGCPVQFDIANHPPITAWLRNSGAHRAGRTAGVTRRSQPAAASVHTIADNRRFADVTRWHSRALKQGRKRKPNLDSPVFLII